MIFTGENDKSATPQTTTENTDSINNDQQRSGNKKNVNRNNRRGLYNNRNNMQLTNYITWKETTAK